jgi:hypothetical protein
MRFVHLCSMERSLAADWPAEPDFSIIIEGCIHFSGGRLIIIDVSLIISGFINLYKQLLIIISSLSKSINQHPRVINHHKGGCFLSSFTKKEAVLLYWTAPQAPVIFAACSI